MNRYQSYLEDLVVQLGGDIPASPACFDGMQALPDAGALGARTKQLMALALAIALGCNDLIADLVRDAMESGARIEEITETIGVAVLTSGGDALTHGARALEVLVVIEEERNGYAMRSGA